MDDYSSLLIWGVGGKAVGKQMIAFCAKDLLNMTYSETGIIVLERTLCDTIYIAQQSCFSLPCSSHQSLGVQTIQIKL